MCVSCLNFLCRENEVRRGFERVERKEQDHQRHGELLLSLPNYFLPLPAELVAALPKASIQEV